MSGLLPLYSAPTPSASSTDLSAIIPGTIFQDEIPPSFIDGAGPEQSSPSSTPSRDGNRAQIEVSPTIQIVLISLGIVVGALFLLGIAAAYYISRKNKLASLEKEKESKSLPPIPDASAADLEPGSGPYSKRVHKQLQHASSFSSNAILLGTDQDRSVCDNIEYGLSRSNTPASICCPSITPSQPGVASPAVTNGVGSPGHNKRNSYVDVAQAYSRRQSQSHITSPAVMSYRMSMALDPSITGTGTIDLYTGIPAYFLSQSTLMSESVYPKSTDSGALAGPSSPSVTVEPFSLDRSLVKNKGAAYPDQSSIHSTGSSFPPPVPSKDCSPFNSPRNSLSIGLLGSYTSTTMARSTNVDIVRTPDISYQPPSQPTSPTAPVFDRGASRRSCTVFTATHGSRHEGRPWHRKRASVVVPDGTAPVRLWKEDAAAVATEDPTLPSAASSMAVGPPRARVFSSQDELQSRYQSGGSSRIARNGAAVFEGVTLQRNAILQRRSLEESSTGSQTFPRRWAAGQIVVDDDEVVQERHHGWVHSPQDSGSFIPYGHPPNGASLDDSLEGKVVISLPSPRGCLLEAEVEALGIQDAYGWPQQHQYERDEEFTLREDPSSLEHPYPTVVRRRPEHLRDKVVSSYRDDYHEQQQQRKSLRQSVADNGEIADGSVTDSNSGWKQPAGLIHSALQRASLYSAARSSPPPSV
ncbi:unnamed protein product [Mortierella alpina]